MDGFVNKRAKKIWKQVRKKQRFQNKRVVDIGCGPGDFMLLALEDGADFVLGIDRDYGISYSAVSKLEDRGYTSKDCEISADKIEDMIDCDLLNEQFDIAICFSALPYFDDMEKVLCWMRDHSRVALVECQYYGDGPGPATISDDGDMRDWLSDIWPRVKKIGSTDVVIRPARRSIWRCTNE